MNRLMEKESECEQINKKMLSMNRSMEKETECEQVNGKN